MERAVILICAWEWVSMFLPESPTERVRTACQASKSKGCPRETSGKTNRAKERRQRA